MSNPINKHPKVRATIAFITVARANQLLGNNSINQRKINKANLAKLTSEMKHDRFQLNGESLIVGLSGRVLNGQHRLLAAINANHGFWTVLVEGVDDDLFYSIDVGKSRNLRDVLFIAGEKNVGALATTLVRMAEYLTNPTLLGSEMTVSNGEALDILTAHPAIRESVNFIAGQSKLRGVIAPSRVAWLHYLTFKQSPEAAQTFFDGLISGAMLSTQSAVYVLRSRLVAEKSNERRLLVRDIMNLLVKGWNAHATEAHVKTLRIAAGEAFPVITFERLEKQVCLQNGLRSV